MGQNILTQSGGMRLAFTTDDATVGTSIANPADTFTRPSGDGVIEMALDDKGLTANALLLKPISGNDSNNADTNTFLLSVFAWEKVIGRGASTQEQYTAHLLASFTCTMTTVKGKSGGIVGANCRYCDTIALGVGNANVSNEIVSPTGDVVATITLDTKGAPLIQLLMARNGSATSENCLYRKF